MSPAGRARSRRRRPSLRPDLRVATAFVLAALAAAGFAVVYVAGGQVQLQGLMLGTAFAGLAYGLAAWSHHLLPQEEVVEERERAASSLEERKALHRDAGLDQVAFPPVIRRTLLAAAGVLAVAVILPLRSLFFREPDALAELEETPWQAGTLLVTRDGDRVRPEDLEVGTMLTVYPEGRQDAADAVTLLVRVEPEELRLPGQQADWAVEGIVAFSKLCTHVGCPIGLFEQTTRHLLCPCHQSAFDVLRGAVPVFGPAARPLPQLPLGVDGNGYLAAQGDFPEPVGPSYWRRP